MKIKSWDIFLEEEKPFMCKICSRSLFQPQQAVSIIQNADETVKIVQHFKCISCNTIYSVVGDE